MKITDIFKTQKRTFSFEFFPPKKYNSALELGINIGRLLKLDPSFVSVTYGAGGSTQDISFDLVDYLQNKLGLTTMAHYTCVNATKQKVENDLNKLNEVNIENLMLLRGDPPKGSETFPTIEGGLNHASDLVEIAAKTNKFAIGVAGYPEGHIESPNLNEDHKWLKYKLGKGGDFVVTQMFFDNNYYFNFVNKLQSESITKRVIPGIMPITNYKQIKRFAELSGSKIPETVAQKFEPYQDNPKKMYQIGVDLAIWQCIDLLRGGAPGLHFYTLNKSMVTADIFASIPKHLNWNLE